MLKVVKVFLFNLGWLVVFGSVSQGAGDFPLRGEKAMVFLEELENKFGKIDSLEVAFQQEKHLKAFADVLTTHGMVYFQAPDKIRVETQKPYRSVMIFDGGSVAKYERIEGDWLKVDVPRAEVSQSVNKQISEWLTGKFRSQAEIYEFFVSSEKEIRLTPRSDALKEFISSIDVFISSDQVERVFIREPEGDETRMFFSVKGKNASLPPALFNKP